MVDASLLGWSVGLLDWLDNPNSKVNRYWRTIEFGSAASQWPWQDQGIVGLWSDVAEPRGGLHGFARTPFEGRKDQKLAPYFRKRTEDLLPAARAALRVYLGGGKGPNMDRLKISYVTIYRRRWQKSDAWSQGGTGRATGRVEQFTRSPRTAAEERRARRAVYHWYMTGATSPSQLPFVYGVIQRPIQPRDYYKKALARFDIKGEELRALRFAFDAAYGITGTVPAKVERAIAGNPGPVKNPIPRGTYAGPTAMASAQVSVEMQSLFRGDRGQFIDRTWKRALQETHELIAISFQEAVAAQMTATHRPTTDALVRATLDERNRWPRGVGF